tara:strand:+ start:752 stop:1177 length:426 start_codon:yes stop_codon:yes gene_type:complete
MKIIEGTHKCVLNDVISNARACHLGSNCRCQSSLISIHQLGVRSLIASQSRGNQVRITVVSIDRNWGRYLNLHWKPEHNRVTASAMNSLTDVGCHSGTRQSARGPAALSDKFPSILLINEETQPVSSSQIHLNQYSTEWSS